MRDTTLADRPRPPPLAVLLLLVGCPTAGALSRGLPRLATRRAPPAAAVVTRQDDLSSLELDDLSSLELPPGAFGGLEPPPGDLAFLPSSPELGQQWSDGEAGDGAALTLLPPVPSPPQPPPQPPPPKEPTLREAFAFALPAMGIYAAPTLMSLIDASFIGRASTAQLAALGPAGSISDSVPFFLLFLSIAATNLCSKAHASGDHAAASRVARTAVLLGGAGGVLLGAGTLLCASSLSRVYCGAQAALLAPLCAKYVAIRAAALPAVVVSTVAQAVCIGGKDARTPMLAVALAALLNLGGDFVLVSRLGWGIAGAAWATALSQLAAMALLLGVLARRGLLSPEPPPPPPTEAAALPPRPPRLATVRAILGFVPFVFVMAIKVSMHNLCAATAASLGGAPAAAHTALMAVAWLCFTFGDVGSSLAQAFLPAFASEEHPPPAAAAATAEEGSAAADGRSPLVQFVYPRRPSPPEAAPRTSFDMAAAWPTLRQLLRCTATISTVVVGLAATLLTAGAGQISSDPAVREQMRAVLPLMAATLSTHGTAITLEGVLLAQKDFAGLAATYTAVGLSCAALLALVRRSGAAARLACLSRLAPRALGRAPPHSLRRGLARRVGRLCVVLLAARRALRGPWVWLAGAQADAPGGRGGAGTRLSSQLARGGRDRKQGLGGIPAALRARDVAGSIFFFTEVKSKISELAPRAGNRTAASGGVAWGGWVKFSKRCSTSSRHRQKSLSGPAASGPAGGEENFAI